MFRRMLPRENSFFEFFEKHAALTVEGAEEFVSMLAPGVDLAIKAQRIKEIEHETDVITHYCVEALHKTLITPIDPDHIHRLITRMDDVMDYIEAASDRLALYKLKSMTPEVGAMADVLVRATEAIRDVCRLLPDSGARATILRKCVDINRLENEADAILRRALVRLFDEEKDAITVIKWKEIYENLESAADRCEDVANIVEGVILEQG